MKRVEVRGLPFFFFFLDGPAGSGSRLFRITSRYLWNVDSF